MESSGGLNLGRLTSTFRPSFNLLLFFESIFRDPFFVKNVSRLKFSEVLVVKIGFLMKFCPYTLKESSGGVSLGRLKSILGCILTLFVYFDEF